MYFNILTWIQLILMNNQTQIQNESIISSTVINQAQTTIHQQISEGSNDTFLYAIAIILGIIIVYLIYKNKTSKVVKKEIALVGQRGSGKTQLFIGLCGGKAFQSVPSIINNTCELEVGYKKFQLCDFMGDNVSKQEILSQFPRFHTIIHVIDGTDSKKLTDSALFIYKMLINKLYQKDPCNYIIFLNKQDDRGFHGKQKLVKRIEDEIETVKLSRRNQVDDNEGEEDYLKTIKTRFDLKNEGIQIVVGSARQNRKGLQEKLLQMCE